MARKDTKDDKTVRDVYLEHLRMAKAGNFKRDDEGRIIPVDLVTERAENNQCLSCGKPRTADDMSGSECGKCGIRSLVNVYGCTKDDAEKEHFYRQERKEG